MRCSLGAGKKAVRDSAQDPPPGHALGYTRERTGYLQLRPITLAAALGIATLLSGAETKPNIVLIVTDDQGWWDLGSHGNPDIETPNLDRLAAEGVELTRFYVQPVCAPTRAGLMTGRHYIRTQGFSMFGAEGWSVKKFGKRLDKQGWCMR